MSYLSYPETLINHKYLDTSNVNWDTLFCGKHFTILSFRTPCNLDHLVLLSEPVFDDTFFWKTLHSRTPVFWDLYVYSEWTYILGHFVFWHPYCFRTTCILKTLSFWSVEYPASGTQRFLGHPVLWKNTFLLRHTMKV